MALLGVAGLAAVLGSMLPGPGPDDAWLRDLLMTVGSSALLFVPFYLITRSLDRHLDRVAADTERQVEEVRTDTARQVEDVRAETARQVEEVRTDVDRRLAEAADILAARLGTEAAADRAAFDTLRTKAPDRDAFWEAMERAHRLGFVASRYGPRVRVSEAARLYVGVEIDTRDIADEPIQFRVERVGGNVEEWVPWPADADGVDVMVEVGRAIYRLTGETFDLTVFLGGLADLLDAANGHPDRRPAIELCPPQWMVCEWGVVAYRDRTYGVALGTLQASPTMSPHVADKPWVDPDSWDAARTVALALYPGRDPWATPSGDDPPF